MKICWNKGELNGFNIRFASHCSNVDHSNRVAGIGTPGAVPGFTGLSASGPRGISEIRSIFGGLFIALGSAPFILGEEAFAVLGFSYLGIAIVRLFSIFFDKSKEQSNWISLGIEIVLGIILML